jgi:hypothetical protein
MKNIAIPNIIMLGVLVGSGIYQFFIEFKIEDLFIPIWFGIMIILLIIDYFILEELR